MGWQLLNRASHPAHPQPKAMRRSVPCACAFRRGLQKHSWRRRCSRGIRTKAREKHIQGMVILKAEISKEGDVTDLSVVSGHALLVPAATEAVKQWKYKPYLLNGQPIAMEAQVSVSFELLPK
jgi:TonB family protein